MFNGRISHNTFFWYACLCAHRWNAFRSHCDFHPRIQLALEVTADLPKSDTVLRWLGENIDLLIIPTHLFIQNRTNYPVLPYAHKMMVLKFLERTNCKFALKTSDDEYANVPNYVAYLRYLYKDNDTRKDPMAG